MSANNFETFDDLVFEHRNQGYGAYLIRKRYSRNVLVAMAVGIAILILLSAIPAISAWITELTKEEIKKDTKVELVDIKPLEETTPPPPPPPPDELPPPKIDMVKFTEPEVVDEPVKDEDLPPPITPENKNIGNENVEGEDIIELPPDNSGNQVVEEPAAPQIFTVVEQMPLFPGGEDALLKYLGKNIKYPEMARDANTQGTIYITFVVDENGKIKEPKVLRGLTGPGAKDCANEAIRVVSGMPAWSAGRQNGKAVQVQYNLPVKFTLR
jgi:protein TonB